MNATHLSMTRRLASRRAAAALLAVTFALGAILAASAQDMFRPVLSPGGINVKSNTIISIGSVVGSNVTLNIQGLEAPYDVQISSDFTNWSHAAYLSLKWPNFSGGVTASNVPPSGFFRACMLGMTNHASRYASYGDYAGVSNVWVGAQNCNGCHGDKVTAWQGTLHANATKALEDTNGVISAFFMANCIVCHSVGRGQSGGFLDLTNTPQLAGVQCENCHGPGNSHIYVSGLDYHPVPTLAPELCGGCHNGSHNPTYNEWTNSFHVSVLPDVGFGVSSGTFTNGTLVTNGVTWNGYIINTDGSYSPAAGIYNSIDTVAGITSGYGRQMSCGPCHSAATRAAMLANYEARQTGTTNYLGLPSPTDGVAWGPTCATCHDPHSLENPKQLRNPMRSTNYFTFFTGSVLATNYGTNVAWSTNAYTYINGVDVVATPGAVSTNVSMSINYKNDVFCAQYDPTIQVCGQCHNSRGARWDGRSKSWNAASNAMVLGTSQSFSRGPHHSVQYNVLIGILQDDYLNVNGAGVATNFNARHGLSVSSRSGNYNTNQCATCHVPIYSVNASTNVTGHTFAMDPKGCALGGCHVGSVPDWQGFQVTTTNSIAMIVGMLNQWATNKGPAIFGANYSKYLQNAWEYNTLGGLSSITNAGPTGSDATKVPDAIKQARFDLYMVANDGSLGVHNPNYVPFVLSDADTKVSSQFALANFNANKTVGLAPLTVNFTNLGVGVTTYSWAFGDGNVSASANPANTYANPGLYTVTFTANGAETLARPSYIAVYTKPVPAFTVGPTNSGTAPLTVYFTNLTVNATSYDWTFTTNALSGTSSDVNPVFTFTNAGNYNVILKANNPGGSASVTNVITAN